MPFACYYFWLVEPLRSDFQNTSEDIPIFEIPIQTKERTCKLAVFVDPAGLPLFVRFEIPGLECEEIPETVRPLIQTVRQHALATLRLTYHGGATFFPHPIWWYSEEGMPFSMGLTFSAKLASLSFDAAGMHGIFAGTFDSRVDITLFVDGHDGRIPLQYRYLSLYKILERRFKQRGRWQKMVFENFLKVFEEEFRKLVAHGKFSNYLHLLRDHCAHIKTNRDAEGVTHLNLTWAAKVERAIPLLAKVCVASINELAGGKFSISHRPKEMGEKNACQPSQQSSG